MEVLQKMSQLDNMSIRLANTINKTNKAINNRKIKTMERIWIQNTTKLNLLNYWYYRYFTNEFEIHIINSIENMERIKG